MTEGWKTTGRSGVLKTSLPTITPDGVTGTELTLSYDQEFIHTFLSQTWYEAKQHKLQKRSSAPRDQRRVALIPKTF